jgi:hypothetical protein
MNSFFVALLAPASSGIGSPVVPDGAVVYPPPDDGQAVVIDGGSWDGVGFRSTGLVGSYPPVTVTLRQTFTTAGTYPYRCLFHPAMAGAVKVG